MDAARAPGAELTDRALNRATLARQLLLERLPLTPAEGTRRVLALQTQEPASAYLALAARLAGFDPAALDAAYAAGDLARGTHMRQTLHTVHVADYPAVHGAMHRRLHGGRLGDPRFQATGLKAKDVLDVLPELLDYLAEPRSKDEVDDWLGARLGTRHERTWWALRTFAPVWHVPNGGAWAFGRGHGFRASPVPRLEPWEEAAGLMLRRYLEAFGPATLADFARFTLLTREMVREAVAAAGDGLVRYRGPGGAELLDVPGAPLPGEDVPAPARLLPMWDSLHLAHEAPGRALSAAHRPAVVKRNGDVLPTLLLDGHVAGVWRPVAGGVEVTTFRRLTRAEWDEVAAEAAGVAALLAARDPRVYARQGNWFREIDGVEVRTLPAWAAPPGATRARGGPR